MDAQAFTLIIQGGSFGLLAWFFVFGFRMLLDRFDKHADKRGEEHKAVVGELVTQFREDRREDREALAEHGKSIDRLCDQVGEVTRDKCKAGG
ncbi:MAG: hypothetical protein IT435_16005 [Phycisphaerales bacterium]|nr:hypothetical protein [Phycisphaerales bacterium]